MSNGNVILHVENLSKTWAEGTERSVDALDNISFDIIENEFNVLIGPSGCGKSTLLFIIAGLEAPSSGMIYLDGNKITQPTPDRQLIFQEPALYPWLSVLDNVSIGLKFKGLSKKARNEIAKEYLKEVGLLDSCSKFPHELSGGMKQRAAIARALCLEPRILLMDEPFAALDVQTRYMMQSFLLNIWQDNKATVIFVTHHIDEAIYLGDRVIMLSARPGKIAVDTYIDLERPREITSKVFDAYRSEFFAHMAKEVSQAFSEQEMAEVMQTTLG